MELCGERAMSNVVLVVNQHKEGSFIEIARQQISGEKYFKPALEMGADASLINAFQNANSTLKKLSAKRPVVLRIQRELIDKGRDFRQTNAGTELTRKMGELITIRSEKIAQLRVSMKRQKSKLGYMELGSDKTLEEKAVQRLEGDMAEMQFTSGGNLCQECGIAKGIKVREAKIDESKQKALDEVEELRWELEEQRRKAKEEADGLRKRIAEMQYKEKSREEMNKKMVVDSRAKRYELQRMAEVEADGFKKRIAGMERTMENMDRKVKEYRRVLEEQKGRAQKEADELRERIAEMQSKSEEDRSRSGESPKSATYFLPHLRLPCPGAFHPLTWQPFNRSSPRPIFTRLRRPTKQRTLRTGVRKMRAKLSKGGLALARRLSG